MAKTFVPTTAKKMPANKRETREFSLSLSVSLVCTFLFRAFNHNLLSNAMFIFRFILDNKYDNLGLIQLFCLFVYVFFSTIPDKRICMWRTNSTIWPTDIRQQKAYQILVAGIQKKQKTKWNKNNYILQRSRLIYSRTLFTVPQEHSSTIWILFINKIKQCNKGRLKTPVDKAEQCCPIYNFVPRQQECHHRETSQFIAHFVVEDKILNFNTFCIWHSALSGIQWAFSR